MWHVVARSMKGRRLFGTWAEGLEVWDTLVRVVPEPEALCVMPDHVHVVCAADVRRPLAQGLAGLARRRNEREGRGGPLMEPLPLAQAIEGGQKLRRSVRYVHLNPCRAGLVDDPLAWPLSTHRDAVGLTWRPVGPRRGDRFHDYVSADPTVAVDGSDLPGGALGSDDAVEVAMAVACVMRTPMARLGRVPLGRSAVRQACHQFCPTPAARVAQVLNIGERTLRRQVAVPAALLRMVQRVLCDRRFGPIDGRGLLEQRGWGRYRHLSG